MNTTLASLREQGIQALREGNLDLAIDVLVRALVADSQDAEAQMFLGVAYSQKGLHAQARRAPQNAVELRPREARWYFNLGVALEQSGDTSGAVDAYRQAVRISPEQPQARARLLGLNAAVDAPHAAARQSMASGDSGSIWGASQSTGGLTMEAASPARPAGTIECSRCRQWSKPGLSCEWCSAPLQRAPAPSTAPWLQPSYAGTVGSSGAGSAMSLAPAMGAGEAFGRRFAASFIDGIIVEVMSLIVGFMSGIAMAGAGGGLTAAGRSSAGALGSALAVVIATAYYAGMLSAFGRTLGKMALGLRVVGPDGGNPSFLRAVLRELIGKFVSCIVLCLGYLWMLWDGEQQTWHDKMAGTHVERA